MFYSHLGRRHGQLGRRGDVATHAPNSHWVESGAGTITPQIPELLAELADVVVVNGGAVTVAANQGAFSLAVNGGSFTVGVGNTLEILKETTVGAAGTLSVNGTLNSKSVTSAGTLSVNGLLDTGSLSNSTVTMLGPGARLKTTSGALAALTTLGSATFEGGATATDLNLAGGSTFTKAGGGTLRFTSGSNTIAAANTVQVDAGVLHMLSAGNPLGGAVGTLNVSGSAVNSGALGVADLTVSGSLTQGANMTTVSNSMKLGSNSYLATSGSFGVRGAVTSVKPEVLVLNGNVTVTGGAAPPVGQPTAGLIGMWTFDDGTATDLTGNGHDGTLIGSPTIDATDLFDPGAGMSLNTNGGNNAVLIGGNEADFDTGGALTVVAWVKERPDGNWEPYISKRGESGQGWQVRRRSSSSNLSFTLRGTSGTDDPQGSKNLGDNNGSGGWIHVVARYDGVRRQVIVDGNTAAPDIDIADTGNIANTGSSVVFGARDNSGNAGNAANIGNWAHVKPDDIFIYDRALTDAEIATIYNGGVALPRGAAPTVLVGGLAGNGTIDASGTGGIEIDAGGLLSPGASVGQIDVIGDLILGEAFIYDWEYENGFADRDLTTVTGELTLPVDAVLNVIDLGGGSLAFTEILLSFGTVAGDPSAWVINGAPAGSTIAIQGNNVVLQAIPEPTSAVLALLGLIGCRWRGRRSR